MQADPFRNCGDAEVVIDELGRDLACMQKALTTAADWAASSRRFATDALSGSFFLASSPLGIGGPYAAFQDASLAAGSNTPMCSHS